MFLHIPNVLSSPMLDAIGNDIAALPFEDGRKTAGWHAREVKANLQGAPSPGLSRIQSAIVSALTASEVFQALALPVRIAPPLVSRSGDGGGYGRHVDDAIMGRSQPLRSDLSVTVFLSDPASYDGGELVIETLSGEDSAKFAAGDAVLYPSTTLHRVEPVTRGSRIVAATWVQSRVREAWQREMLIDLDRARRQIFAQSGKCDTFDLVAKTYANLMRQWAEV